MEEGPQTKSGLLEEYRIILDADNNQLSYYMLRDVPVSFDQSHRRFGFRRVYETTKVASQKPTGHDAMSALE